MPEDVKRATERLNTRQRRQVLEISQRLAATLGQGFFQSMVRHLAEAVGAEEAYIGELKAARQDHFRTLAVYRRDGESGNVEQDISGTAAGRVLLDGLYTCNQDATKTFPLDRLLESMHAQAYAGIRLRDSAGQPVGVLAIVSKERLADTELVRSLLETFAPRTAAELERKRDEDLHRENEERYRAFVSTNPDAMWRLEFAEPIPLTLGEEELIDRMYLLGYLAEYNDAYARLAGFESAQEMVGAPLGAILPRTDERVMQQVRSAIRSGFRETKVEASFLDANGQVLYRSRSQVGIVEDDQLRRVWITTRDITVQRRTELALTASERRFREVLEGVQLPAIMLDQHGTITFANESFLRLSRRSKEELSVLNWLAGVIPAEESAIWKSILAPTEPGRQANTHFEGAILPREGPRHLIEWSAIGLHNHEGSLTGIAAIGRDATRERVLEMEIRQAQKLDSIGRLAAGVAHDFNNLLTAIVGYSSHLLGQVAESDPKRQQLAEIQDAAVLCTKLTGQLLAVGRKQSLHPESIVLNEVIASSEGIIRGLTGAGIDVHFDLQPDLWRVYADPTQILRALTNLVTNARDAMPGGGKLTIRTSNLVIPAGDAVYLASKPGNYVRLSVVDTGMGIPGDVRAHIFEPFFTTKTAGRGTGLGLATVYGIVTQSGGQILVCSEPGNGAVFEVILPASASTLAP